MSGSHVSWDMATILLSAMNLGKAEIERLVTQARDEPERWKTARGASIMYHLDGTYSVKKGSGK